MKPLPRIAWLLGYGGLLPFFVLFLLIKLNPTAFSIDINLAGLWLLAYAAVILSFLGAVHWGVALFADSSLSVELSNRLYLYSVMPSILAWLVLLLPLKIALFSMAGLIVLAYVADRLLLFSLLESQYQRLRLHLTIAVSVLLLATGLSI